MGSGARSAHCTRAFRPVGCAWARGQDGSPQLGGNDATAGAGGAGGVGGAVGEHGLTDAVLIARCNDTSGALNERARQVVRDRGCARGDVDYGPVTVAVGDRVICRRNDREVDVDNGTRGTVRAAAPYEDRDRDRRPYDARAARRLRRPARRARLRV